MNESFSERKGQHTWLIVFISFGLVVVGVILWQVLTGVKETAITGDGFDLASADKAARTRVRRTSGSESPGSGLGMVRRAGAPSFRPKAGEAAARGGVTDEVKEHRENFRDAVRRAEKKIARLARRYTEKYPIIRQYGEEWMSHPDLKKLNDDYMRDRDPVAFMKGLVKSQNFTEMIRKYAPRPEVSGFVSEAMTATAMDMPAAMEFANDDQTVLDLVTKVSQTFMPPKALPMLPGKAASGYTPEAASEAARQRGYTQP